MTSCEFKFTFAMAPSTGSIIASDDEDNHSACGSPDERSDHTDILDESDVDGATGEDSPPMSVYESDAYSPPPSPTGHPLSFSSSTILSTNQEGFGSHGDIKPKRLYSERASNTPNTSPQKKKTHIHVPSSIWLALDAHDDPASGEPQGLMQFWTRGSKEKVKAYWDREMEIHQDNVEEEAYKVKIHDDQRKVAKTEAARLWKQKQRQRKKESQIRSGERTPGGRK